MRHDLLSPYVHRSSAVHRLLPGVKLTCAVALVFVVVLLPRTAWIAYAAVGAILLLTALLSRIPPLYLGRRLLLVEPFAVGVAVLSLFQKDGVVVFLAMLTKSTLCLLTMVLLSCTTRFTDLLRVLWRVRVPSLLVTTLALLHRYLFLLFDEMGRMVRARTSRTFVAGQSLPWRAMATILGHLFVRTSERAERVYAAMYSRGWKT